MACPDWERLDHGVILAQSVRPPMPGLRLTAPDVTTLSAQAKIEATPALLAGFSPGLGNVKRNVRTPLNRCNGRVARIHQRISSVRIGQRITLIFKCCTTATGQASPSAARRHSR